MMKILLLLALPVAMALASASEPPTLKAPSKQLPEAQIPIDPGQKVGGEEVALPAPSADLEILFAYSSEKKGWIEEITKTYHHSSPKLGNGRSIGVKLLPLGSGVIIDRLLKPTGDPDLLQAHVVSPASSVFIKIGNGEALERDGAELISEVEDLVSSPLVLALWSELADATDWRTDPPSWSEVFSAVGDSSKWKGAASKGNVDVPPLLLGHTDPDKSNSGLLSLILMVESAINSKESFKGVLDRAEIRAPEVEKSLLQFESGVVHPLSESTGFLADVMTAKADSKMNAALIYESLVIEKNREGGSRKLVAIYPREGVFANEHPIGVVQKPWVGTEHKEAALHYISFLRSRAQQERAKAHGFRPIDKTIPIDDLLRPELGVSPAEIPALPSPSSQMIKEARAVWREISSKFGPNAKKP